MSNSGTGGQVLGASTAVGIAALPFTATSPIVQILIYVIRGGALLVLLAILTSFIFKLLVSRRLIVNKRK